ncbi:unnamed protein product [Nezara viridula]|uniref:Uncharacterized protein n=1 Tax=Nezara viridula TaxID=85310 RepID=A0A9P0H910_NEZVI|nr:unnamed protein product [Nezara viridula]
MADPVQCFSDPASARMETKSLWSPSIIAAAVTSLFKLPAKKKMNKIKTVTTDTCIADSEIKRQTERSVCGMLWMLRWLDRPHVSSSARCFATGSTCLSTSHIIAGCLKHFILSGWY